MRTQANTEKWDYKMDGKPNGMARLIICAVLFAVFAVLGADQLSQGAKGSMILAVSFLIPAALMFTLTMKLAVRFFCFQVYIGKTGFYFKNSPFHGRYYAYSEIASCKEEEKISNHRPGGIQYYYFFTFVPKNEKPVKFQFEKPVWEREVDELKKRMEVYAKKQMGQERPAGKSLLKDGKRRKFIPLLLVGLILLSSAGIYFFKTAQYRDWVTAPGVIVKIEQYHTSSSHGSSRSHRIYYAYEAHGAAYTGSNLYSGNETDFKENEEVTVWVDPSDASHSSFHKPSPGLDPFCTLLFRGSPAFCGGWDQ